MDFHFRNIHACQCVPDSITVMSISSRINYNTGCSIKIGFLDPVDNGSFMIALERLDLIPGLLCLFVDQIQQILIILP